MHIETREDDEFGGLVIFFRVQIKDAGERQENLKRMSAVVQLFLQGAEMSERDIRR